MYKKKVQELHEQVLNDEMKFKKLEYEYKAIEEEHVQSANILRADKNRFQHELDRLKETHEQLVINSQTFNSTSKSNSILNLPGILSICINQIFPINY